MDVTLIPVVSALVVLASSAVQDIRRREVDDSHWWSLLLVSSCCLVISPISNGFRVDVLFSVSASVLIYAALVSEGSRTLILGTTGAVLWIFAVLIGDFDELLTCCLLSPLFEGVFIALYVVGVLRGGADVKCLLVLSVGFPLYPFHQGGIVCTLLPPAVSILFTATMITFIAGGLWLVWMNRHGDLRDLPNIRIPLERAENSHVWLCEDVENGEVRRASVPLEEKSDAVRRLREHGAEDVLVSPMFPFIVPLAVAFAVTVVTGCPFLI